MLTKDRVGAGLAIAAAVLGLVLVFSFPQSGGGGDDDDAAPATPPVGQVVPAPGGQVQPAPGQVEQPAAPQDDADGDDDG